tara:strand:- start:170 stop:328 length:159 start_codon:yes stop_codon:yes gene_type:complete
MKNKSKTNKKQFYDRIISRYSRNNPSLNIPGNYITKEDKDKLKEKVLKHKFI